MKIQFDPPVIAHRGARNLAPENTIAAFVKAKQLGCRWLEFDVRQAACGELIIFHDDELDRTTNGHGFVESYPYEYLKTLDAGLWFAPVFSNTKIPTFREMLVWLNAENMAANIEIKTSENKALKIAIDILQQLNSVSLQVPFFISSFESEVLKYIRSQSQDILLAYLMDEWQPNWETIADQIGAFAIDVNHQILDESHITEIKKTQRYLLAYTVNQPERARMLLNMGVDAVFSDDPSELISFLRL